MPTTTAFFVAADWLAGRIDDPKVQILDTRTAPPGQESRDVGKECRAGHIPGAIFFDIEALSDHTSSLPHTTPRPEALVVTIRELGISRDKHLVTYDDGNLLSAPRARWMLRAFGVENVSILVGGLTGWKRDELILRGGDEDLSEDELNVAFTSGAIVHVTDILLASHEKTAQVVDVRPVARFNGEADEPCPSPKRGRVPGVLNVPWTKLIRDGELKTTDELDTIFFSRGVSFDCPITANHGPGVMAAVVVLTLATLGVTDVALYDSVWSEQGTRNDLPIEPQL